MEYLPSVAVPTIAIHFNVDVSSSLNTNLLLLTTPLLGYSQVLSYDKSNNVATFQWTQWPERWPDGNYQLEFRSDNIRNAAGVPLLSQPPFDFFVLAGDLNRDRQVSISDFLTLASNFGKTNADYFDGDLNYDGIVSISDFLQVAANFSTVLPAQAATAVASEDKAVVLGTQETLAKKVTPLVAKKATAPAKRAAQKAGHHRRGRSGTALLMRRD
jgi:hypothetical protein